MHPMKSICVAITLALASSALAAPIPGGTLSPVNVPKYVDNLVVPPLMNPNGETALDIAVRPLTQQVLPPGYKPTPVWGYGDTKAGNFNWPAFTIQAKQFTPTTVTWRNQLVDVSGGYVPHLFTIDQTLHWANPTKAN